MNRFWHDAERGPTGDHGQAGQDGHDGHIGPTGPRGPAGETSRGERGKPGGSTPALRARMMVLYLVVIVLLASVAVIYKRGESASRDVRRVLIENCYQNQTNTIRFNKFVDKLIATYQNSKLLTAKEKAERADFFADAKGDVPTCPPNGVGP